jgi:hypothetical protein
MFLKNKINFISFLILLCAECRLITAIYHRQWDAQTTFFSLSHSFTLSPSIFQIGKLNKQIECELGKERERKREGEKEKCEKWKKECGKMSRTDKNLFHC